MSYSTAKNKLFKLWNDSIENQFRIINSSNNRTIILNKIASLNRTNQSFKNVIELSSEWLDAENQYMEDTDAIFDLFQEFTIEINGIHKSLIPYIQCKIVYRLSDSNPSPPIPDSTLEEGTPFDEKCSTFNINDFIEIRNILADNRRNITYHCSVFMSGGGKLPDNLQFKFYITLFNPNSYQST